MIEIKKMSFKCTDCGSMIQLPVTRTPDCCWNPDCPSRKKEENKPPRSNILNSQGKVMVLYLTDEEAQDVSMGRWGGGSYQAWYRNQCEFEKDSSCNQTDKSVK